MPNTIWGDPLWGDGTFVDPTSTGGGTGGGSGSGGGTFDQNPHVYWRLHTLGGTYGAVAEFVPFDGTGTQIPTTGGSASTDDATFGAAANAFDGNAGTFWSPDGPSTFPHWLKYQFPVAVDIESFTIATRNDGGWGDSIVDFDLQYSDDGSTWTTKYAYRGVAWSSNGQVITFNADNALPPLAIAWRLLVNSSYGLAQVQIGDIVLRDSGGTAIPTTRYAATASTTWGPDATHGAYAAFNGDGNTLTWSADGGFLTGWVAYRFGTLAQVASFCIQSPNGPGPSSVTLQYSLDESSWTSVVTQAPLSNAFQQCFTLGGTFPGTGAASIALAPSFGIAGQTYNIAVTGTASHFDATTAVTVSGGGVTVSNVVVTDATDLTFTLALSSGAALGARTVTTQTGAEVPTAVFTVLQATVAPVKRGDIGWSQIRLGLDGTWGSGAYGASTDGSVANGEVPIMGGPDGMTLVGGGGTISSLGTQALTVNGAATVTVNGAAVSFNTTATVNGA